MPSRRVQALIADGRTWPLTFELYLPDSWMTDPARRTAAGIPDTARFRQKWRIGLAHVRTVLHAGFTLAGVVVDADYGSNAKFREGLERLGLRYGVAIRGNGTFWTVGAKRTDTAAVLADAAFPEDWHTVTWGTSTTGRVVASFYAVRVRARTGRGERWLLCERSADDVRKFYLLNLAPTARLKDLVALARARWPIEQQYRELKDELGLDHFEGRSYRGWAHHTVLTAVAFTFLQLERARTTATVLPTLPVVRGWVREIIGLLYVIHNRPLLRTLDSLRRNPPLRRRQSSAKREPIGWMRLLRARLHAGSESRRCWQSHPLERWQAAFHRNAAASVVARRPPPGIHAPS